MSLLDEYMTDCCYVVKTDVDDGAGGSTSTYTEGDHFTAAIVRGNTSEVRIAEGKILTDLFTITAYTTVDLPYNTIIKRTSDGHCFRITSDSDDMQTPASASIQIRQVNAERWRAAE